MRLLKVFYSLLTLTVWFNSYAADEWTAIGKTTDGTVIFATNADVLNDGTLRMFVKGEKEIVKQPEGTFAMFKKPEKYKEYMDPFPILLNCKKKVGRKYVPGPLGSEFHVPWEPLAPGSLGYVAFNAFCKK